MTIDELRARVQMKHTTGEPATAPLLAALDVMAALQCDQYRSRLHVTTRDALAFFEGALSSGEKERSGEAIRSALVDAIRPIRAAHDLHKDARSQLSVLHGRHHMTLDELRKAVFDVELRPDIERMVNAALDVVEAVRRDHVEGRNTHTARAYFEQQLPALRAFDAALSSGEKGDG